jgi:hypothetical protein
VARLKRWIARGEPSTSGAAAAHVVGDREPLDVFPERGDEQKLGRIGAVETVVDLAA